MKTLVSILTFATLIVTLLSPLTSSADECLATMTRGKYRGQCIDTAHKRAIRILDRTAETITIANYRKNGRFYKAVIPFNDVTQMSYVIVDLNATPLNSIAQVHVSHTELRFHFNKGAGVELYDLDQPISEQSFAGTDEDFLISLNYMAPKGVPYDPVKGLDGNLFASALQVLSLSEEVDIRFQQEEKFNVYEITLDIPSDQAALVLKTALFFSNNVQYTIPYDSWNSNCTTVLFDILDAGLRLKGQKPYRFSVLKVHDTGMVSAFRALGQRHLVHDETSIQSVNAEFGYGLFPSKSNRHFAKFIGKTYREIKWSLL
ncbi:MAG: hypothetical protein ACM3MG_12225 [Bacillota bacterium]